MAAVAWTAPVLLAAAMSSLTAVGIGYEALSERWPVPLHATRDVLAWTLFVATGALLATAGGVLAVTGSRRAGRGPAAADGAPAAAVAGLAWTAPLWSAWGGTPPGVRMVADVAAVLLPAALLHLALVQARLLPPRKAVLAVYAGPAVVALARTLVTDRFLDPGCRHACAAPTLHLMSAPDTAQALGVVLLVAAGVTAVATTVCAAVTVRAEPARRPGATTTAALLGLAGVLEVLWVAQPGAQPIDGPLLPENGPWLFAARALTLMTIAVVTIGLALHRAARVRAVAGLARRLGEAPAPGTVAAVLARDLRVDRVDLLLRLPGTDRWVDASGRPVPTPRPSAHAATLTRRGRALAVVSTHPPVSLTELDDALGPAAALAVDSERVHAQLLAQAELLRASQRRVVDVTDGVRRQLERDLHDGAQQRLIAASYEFRLLCDAARAAGDQALAARAAHWVDRTLETLLALRTLAGGVYPGALAAGGLAPALEALADDADVLVTVRSVPARRFRAEVEHTAYLVAQAAVRAARYGTIAAVDVNLWEADDQLVVEVEGATTADLDWLADRVSAHGGDLRQGDGVLRAAIPCE